ncbi:MAG: cytochrome c oxidase subunit I [Dehalococcoidia bacterium]|nr:cytochrome c oxidase subunit I [Chloroflexota bacterium]
MVTANELLGGVLAKRPVGATGVMSWITTIDHKRIGILYGVTGFIFFILGGIEALLMRLQLSSADAGIVSPEVYNQLFTMHGTTMIFLVVMPLGAAFFNFMIPLMIGARDVAFPRLNAFSYWMFLFGAILLNVSFLTGGAPNVGWFAYSPLTSDTYSIGQGVDFWILGLLVLGVSSMAAAFNFIVTIVNMRAPGMTMMKIPVFVWMTLIISFLLILAFPVITVAITLLLLDRLFGTVFFDTAAGANPLLWQHFFWAFGHPEVYILILPAMGIVSEILPVFSRKPLFGYTVVVFSGVLIGVMGWGVWSHHMFTVGLGPVANSAFALITMFIAVPTGIKIFNWIATMWGGSIRFTTPMLFSIGFIGMFVIGGLSGVMHAVAPSDTQQSDTYFVVAHLHYVLFGGSIFGLFAGIYHWWPKITGRLLNEFLGKVQFWLFFIGFNVTFFPMHFLGLDGMPRRIYTYSEGQGWEFWNVVSTVGVFIIGLSLFVFIQNVVRTLRHGEKAGNDPWDGRTLEWSIPSPPPEYNFAQIPTVTDRDAHWAAKYSEGPDGRPVPKVQGAAQEEVDTRNIHMPTPSYYPVLLAAGLTLIAGGLVSHLAVSVIGGILALFSIYSWALEPATDPDAHRDHGAY